MKLHRCNGFPFYFLQSFLILDQSPRVLKRKKSLQDLFQLSLEPYTYNYPFKSTICLNKTCTPTQIHPIKKTNTNRTFIRDFQQIKDTFNYSRISNWHRWRLYETEEEGYVHEWGTKRVKNENLLIFNAPVSCFSENHDSSNHSNWLKEKIIEDTSVCNKTFMNFNSLQHDVSRIVD